MVCLCRRCPSPHQVPHRASRALGALGRCRWHDCSQPGTRRGASDTTGLQSVPAGGLQKWQEEDGDQVARAPEGWAGSHGEVQELRFFCAFF